MLDPPSPQPRWLNPAGDHLWLYVRGSLVWMWPGALGRDPALKAMLSPSSCLSSTAALSYKILCCSNCWEKKPTPQAVRAPSSSAGNDCWVMDLRGDNFELLSALKPCSLLCAADEMCWLPRPGSGFSLLSLAGEGQRGSAPSLNDPCAQQAPRKARWGAQGSALGVSGLPAPGAGAGSQL